MRPPPPDSSSTGRLARYTPDSRRWRYTFAGVSAVAAPILFYYTVRLISSTWSGTLPSLLVLVGSVLTLVAAALPPTLLLAADGGSVSADSGGEDDAIAELKRRYASGDVSEAEFERRLETLIETPFEDRRQPSEPGSRETGRAATGVESELN
ncbi:SHOCT domain-containing protein [Halobellus ruber]|uniref:SHOCT domain-containing protein n=1 Tax=Halobellus ruber TaxID=2761102 RepID=A0A7J9SK94_9EURY|nr:SHOCT domain-containing protein [Halobellus ruber]MBB6646932.1 SHOCT domain-containing protein [Halobellus ruber]